MVEAAGVGEEHLPPAGGPDQVGDPAPHGHGLALRVEAGGALHPAFREEEDHLSRPGALHQLAPGLVALAGDGDDIARHEAEEAAHQGALEGLVGDGDHPLPGDSPEEPVGGNGGEDRLVEARMVEDRDDPDVGSPRVLPLVAHPAPLVAEEDPGEELDEQEDRVCDEEAHGAGLPGIDGGAGEVYTVAHRIWVTPGAGPVPRRGDKISHRRSHAADPHPHRPAPRLGHHHDLQRGGQHRRVHRVAPVV